MVRPSFEKDLRHPFGARQPPIPRPGLTKVNCDRIARYYRWLEYAAFGRSLERCRNLRLSSLNDARKVLMLGEGDGRFLNAFIALGTDSVVDYVDSSAAMLTIAARRLATCPSSATIRFFQMDAVADRLPESSYDLVVTNFFLDCFEDRELGELVAKVADSTIPGARWLVSEFREPVSGFWRYLANLILYAMYTFFRWTTALTIRALPVYNVALVANGFSLEHEQFFLKGFLVAELWARPR